MSDADRELGPILRERLLARRAPDEVRARLLRSSRPTGWRWSLAAAAGILLVLGALAALFLVPPAVPDEVRDLAGFHHEYKEGEDRMSRSDAQSILDKTLSTREGTPSAEVAGFRVAEARPVGEAVQIVYTRGATTLSAFVVRPENLKIADDRFETRDGVTFCAYDMGPRRGVAVKAGDVLRLWVSRLPREDLIDAVMTVERHRASFQKVELRIEGG